MPSILAQSMACAWAPAAVVRTTPQAARSLITRMILVLRDFRHECLCLLTVALEPAAPNDPTKQGRYRSLPAAVRIRVECASPLTPDDAPIIAGARTHPR